MQGEGRLGVSTIPPSILVRQQKLLTVKSREQKEKSC